ncbi:MAG TPA: universal stress protein, partial [Pilimelia sp.]|nr:universal stress protein [Pilimelia sp.]
MADTTAGRRGRHRPAGGGQVTRPIVAGVDGSPASLVAADVAARMAAARSRPLHLVHGYLHPFGYGVPIDPYAGL